MALQKMTYKQTSKKWNLKCKKSGSKTVSPLLRASISSINFRKPQLRLKRSNKIVTAVISAVKVKMESTKVLTV